MCVCVCTVPAVIINSGMVVREWGRGGGISLYVRRRKRGRIFYFFSKCLCGFHLGIRMWITPDG